MMKLLLLIAMVFGFVCANAQEGEGLMTEGRTIVVEDMSGEQIQNLQLQLEDQGFKGPVKWACYAENRYREIFRAIHKDRRRAERNAMEECLRWSRRCYYAGCERIIRIPF